MRPIGLVSGLQRFCYDVPAATGSKAPALAAPGKKYGPDGGIVLITPSTIGNTEGQYFEVAPFADFGAETRAVWRDTKTLIGVSGTHIGTGAGNTALAAASYPSGASGLSLKYTDEGASDWFLPSKDELNEMYKHTDIKGCGSGSLDRQFCGKHGSVKH